MSNNKANYIPDSDIEGKLQDDSYVTSQKNESVPVQGDNERVEDPVKTSSADSDEQLEQDDREAIEKANIIDERTRGSKPRGSYQEPGDEEMLSAE
ncbi:hypothetical protein M441DRAFT_170637 [Trichoderma asperellum CBS 433.97]|uniref:Histone chaperone domain-containing protein n=1 Tax=Trichoderma asperellum (strain ATCC 204424 / CBS 433.97 / NBRC 101777) TaxID=1042311 RepID=A0A2T3Z6K6_TRIA4|nr:hypothetical protein M441DRAFT_170637 [Trichoderma asperellum CBS 433.97]PTB40439.1 hypothetical protein M441DRAFT_170637 [Trichoderma asperellum CBS 433.97]